MAVICQNGYLMITGVLYPTPNSRKRIFCPLRVRRKFSYRELKKDLEGISQKVLTDSLRSMEADGIITRTVYPEVPPRVEYALSKLGESMRPIMDAMEIWGTEYKKSMG